MTSRHAKAGDQIEAICYSPDESLSKKSQPGGRRPRDLRLNQTAVGEDKEWGQHKLSIQARNQGIIRTWDELWAKRPLHPFRPYS